MAGVHPGKEGEVENMDFKALGQPCMPSRLR